MSGPASIVLAGASGTIGRAVAAALLEAGHNVTCVVRRSASGEEATADPALASAQFHFVEAYDEAQLFHLFEEAAPQVVISCIASRTGEPGDAKRVDLEANLALLGEAERSGAEQFISLSAICLQRPHLAFQHAKLAFEERLAASDIAHTIVRPTAFFKSLSGQVDRVARGKPFLVFGSGEATRCKPIGNEDLARFIADCVGRADAYGRILTIGGPGPALSPREQGAILFELTGRAPRYRSVPVGLFPLAARVLSLGERWSGRMARGAEYARIAHYYATESMLVLDTETSTYSETATPSFGTQTLRAHYAKLLAERG
ncbi:MAG: NAD(P)H-binding protein [Erythrobacter sp.]